jgi:hypothetical protein
MHYSEVNNTELSQYKRTNYSSFFNAVEKVRQPNIQSSRLPRYFKFIYNKYGSTMPLKILFVKISVSLTMFDIR